MNVKARQLFYAATIVSIFMVCVADFVAALDHKNLFNSPVFYDPAYIQEMPQEWIDKPIAHPAEVGDIDVYMTLSYQLYDLLADEIRRYAKENSFTVEIKKAACSTSTRMLLQKEIDIASFCCSPANSDHLPGVKFHTAGIIPVSILVNRDNSVNNVSLVDLKQIFRGQIVNWAQLGGEDLLIQPVARLHCKTRPGRWRVLDKADDLASNIMLVGAIDDNFKFISQTSGSVGYESLPGSNEIKYAELKKLKVDGVDSNNLPALARGDYPYFRSYTFSEWTGEGLGNPYSRQIIEFIDKKMLSMENPLGTVPLTELKKNGWKFSGEELVGLPH